MDILDYTDPFYTGSSPSTEKENRRSEALAGTGKGKGKGKGTEKAKMRVKDISSDVSDVSDASTSERIGNDVSGISGGKSVWRSGGEYGQGSTGSGNIGIGIGIGIGVGQGQEGDVSEREYDTIVKLDYDGKGYVYVRKKIVRSEDCQGL